MKNKIALFCTVPSEAVIEVRDEATIYNVPISLHNQKLDDLILKYLGLEYKANQPDLSDWARVVDRYINPPKSVKIALVGKYVQHKDAYLSVVEALHHAGIFHNVKVEVISVESEDLENCNFNEKLKFADGILIPGGFGSRGIDGMINAIKYARENKVPILGICLGMQMMVVEYARNVAGISDAHSIEMDENTLNPVIHLMHDQEKLDNLGGTMRLGAYPCDLSEGTRVLEAYKTFSPESINLNKNQISERHRHRYEFNNEYKERLENAGLKIAGVCSERNLVEIIELKDHPWFMGCQFHCELKSRPIRPHPLFAGFIGATLKG